MQQAFLNRKALSAKALSREKSSTLNAEILSFSEAEDTGGLSPTKDDNEDNGQKIKFKAGSHSSPQLKVRVVGSIGGPDSQYTVFLREKELTELYENVKKIYRRRIIADFMVGIIPANFPGEKLISAVIRCNFR